MRSRGEREARLQQISRWITDRSRWIDSARTPSSRAELQRSIDVCQVRGHICVRPPGPKFRFNISAVFSSPCLVVGQDLQEKIGQKSAALQELRDKRDGGDEVSSCDFICQTDKSIQACAALTRQVKDTQEDVQCSVTDNSNFMTVNLPKEEVSLLEETSTKN